MLAWDENHVCGSDDLVKVWEDCPSARVHIARCPRTSAAITNLLQTDSDQTPCSDQTGVFPWGVEARGWQPFAGRVKVCIYIFNIIISKEEVPQLFAHVGA